MATLGIFALGFIIGCAALDLYMLHNSPKEKIDYERDEK